MFGAILMFYMENKIKKNLGFTLLETLIALSVISVGVMAAFTLSTANLNTARANAHRVLAANLAREGVEFVRNVRDSNWLKIEANFDCDTVTAGTQLCAWDEYLDQTTSTISFDNSIVAPLDALPVGVNDVADCFNEPTCLLSEKEEAGNYHLYKQSTGENATNMARLVILKAICLNNGDLSARVIASDVACPETHKDKIGLQVTSQVYWVDFSKEHSIEVVEELYNWREYET